MRNWVVFILLLQQVKAHRSLGDILAKTTHNYTLHNYMNNALLYAVHLCMRGNDDVIGEELYQGTAKAAEG